VKLKGGKDESLKEGLAEISKCISEDNRRSEYDQSNYMYYENITMKHCILYNLYMLMKIHPLSRWVLINVYGTMVITTVKI
jgi:hypothetical protein